MSLKSLNTFLLTAELGNFSAASRAIGVTPAAISKSINELEQELGVRLFHRNTRSLSLTEDGISFLNDIKPVLTTLDGVLNKTRNAMLLPEGKLKVNVPESFGKNFIIPLIPEFLKTYPEMRLDLYLQDKKVDPTIEGFDVSIGNLEEVDSGIVARDLCQLQLVTIASARYLKRNAVPKTPADLKFHNCISYKQLSSGRIIPWRYNVGKEIVTLNPTGNLSLSNIEAVANCVKADIGIACVGMWHVKKELSDGSIIELFNKFRPEPLKVKIYYPSKNLQSKKVRVFIDYLINKSKLGVFN